MLSIGKAAKYLGYTQQTLRTWDKEGKLVPALVQANGFRRYTQEQLDDFLAKNSNIIRPVNKITVGYCRVSSKKQEDDLLRQKENIRQYLLAQGKPFDIITDIGSGINYTKKGLQDLIRRIERLEVNKIVILYKDRLLRFGFELFEYIAELHGVEIEIIDNEQKTEEQELVEDLIQIITVFSCRLQGRRSNRTKKLMSEFANKLAEGEKNA
jgi:predicted site-specific integrase-resolvase